MTDAQKQELEHLIEMLISTNAYDYAVQKLIYSLEQNGTHPNTLHTLKTEFPPQVLPPSMNIGAPPHRYVEMCLNVLRDSPVPFTKKQSLLLEQILTDLNLGDVYSFVLTQMIQNVASIIQENLDIAKKLEIKYGFKHPDDLLKKFDELTQFDTIEKEDDQWAWEDAIDEVLDQNSILSRLKALSSK